MKTVRSNIQAALASCRRDMLIYFSYRGRVATRVIGIFVMLSTFYYISRLIDVHQFKTSSGYFSYVVIGLVIAEILESTIAIGLNVRSELLTGTFERLICSPYGAVNGIAAALIFPVLLQLVLSTVTLCIGAILFGMRVRWSTAPLAIPVALAGALLFSAFALLGAAAVLVAKQTAAGTVYAASALGLLGGIYFPTSLLPAWGRVIADVQPLTYFVNLMRHYLIGYPLYGSLAGAIAHVLGFLVVSVPFAYLALAQAVKFTRRRATVLEY